MKIKNLLSLALMAFVAFQFISCSDDDDNPNPGPNTGEFVASIDGQEFLVSGTNVIASLFNGNFAVTATNTTTNEVIVINITNDATGTYDLGPNAEHQGTYSINQENAYVSRVVGGSGTANITKIDVENELASGTFEFVGVRESIDNEGNIVTETITITGGSFSDVPLISEIPGNSNNSFGADIDGVALNPDAVNALETTFQGQTTISISAFNNATNKGMGLTLPGDITTGTYDFESLPLPGAIVGQYIDENQVSWVSVDGTITINNVDTAAGTMDGTFEFTAGDFLGQDPTTFEITNGTFSVEF